MDKSRKIMKWLGIVLVTALILILPLVVVSCGTKPIPVVSATSVPSEPPTPASTETPMDTPTAAFPTAAPVIANGQEPPPCTFPLAQITTTESAPENYTFSEPKVVLTAPKDNLYTIAEWLPDNQQILMTEGLFNAAPGNNDPPQESISLYNPTTGVSRVYAVRTLTPELPSWLLGLNAVVYAAKNYTSFDTKHFTATFTRQIWMSRGDPKTAQLLADDLPQFNLAIKPGGSAMLYLSDKQISKRSASLQGLPSTSFDPTQWDYAKTRRNNFPVSYEMAWQPGTSLVFLYSGGAMGGGGYTFVLNADTGRVCELNLGGWAQLARWSSDGRYLAINRATEYSFPIPESDLTVLDTVTGKLTTLSGMPQGISGQLYIYDFIWAPDNRHLLALGSTFPSQNNQGESGLQGLYLVDFVSGQSVNVIPSYKFYTNTSQSMAWSPNGSKVVVRCPTNLVDRICLIYVQKSGQ